MIWPWPASLASSQATLICAHSGLAVLALLLFPATPQTPQGLGYLLCYKSSPQLSACLMFSFYSHLCSDFTSSERRSLNTWFEMPSLFMFISLCFGHFIFVYSFTPSACYREETQETCVKWINHLGSPWSNIFLMVHIILILSHF